MTTTGFIRLCAISAFALTAACQDMSGFSMNTPAAEDEGGAEVTRSNSTRLIERDVEAPDVFQVTSSGLWDGRPSLGGVWVAHPDAKDPERVIIRNEENGKFVIGALFRKERDTPGPALQVSSDAAAALGILAGSPTGLNVTALRKESVPEQNDSIGALPVAAEVSSSNLDDPIANQAAAAIEAAAPNPQPIPGTDTADTAVITKAAAQTPAQTAAPATTAKSPLSKPYVQIGFFSVEANARRTADNLRSSGVVPSVVPGESNGKAFWRVIVGPSNTSAERAEVLKTVKSKGFSDAYFVTN
ncbi:SPOR domain-containing protein [Shimia ponticola]|uniref:SPOR domain-containing protein n=1 Tax=Shimia ponticola TaxID=2582893 RepID=UPI0011BF4C3C|nr:SPOR domain-containing protein [Shimia ponticola]